MTKTWNSKEWSPLFKAADYTSQRVVGSSAKVATTIPTHTANNRCQFKQLLEENQQYLSSEQEKNCLIVCNSTIPLETFEYLWSKSILVICADGGANQLYRYFEEKGGGDMVQKWIPDYIKGDLDSVEHHVKEYYTSKGVTITLDKSQDTTDLQKAMELVNQIEQQYSFKFNNIFISGGLGGNLSHEFANMNVLYEYPQRNLVLFSMGNFACLLNSNYKHTINLRKNVHCSLIPLSAPAQSVTTTGLKWNLQDNSLKFGELISTSNITSEDTITCTTSSPLIFVIDLIH